MLALAIAIGAASCYFFVEKYLILAVPLLIVTLFLFLYVVSSINKVFRDVENFANAVRYRDFSKRYAVSSGSKKNKFYSYFNEISDIFLSLNKEKEIQQQYLKKMLELIDTGILAYKEDNHDILWMNEAFKSMFTIPAIKNINWLQTRQNTLYAELMNIPLGENRLITITIKNQMVKTLVNAHSFQTEGKLYKMIAFHNIDATLEEVEANAWKGLLSVMTHEIMNSIAPVASLADTLKKRMESLRQENNAGSRPEFEDIEFAMDTIHRRSEGLLRFADTYRNLSKTINLEITSVRVSDMLGSIYQLMSPSLLQKDIKFEIKTDFSSIFVMIDRGLIEQVIINFITNAAYAVKDRQNPEITLHSGRTAEGDTYITVADNGCGISPDVRDKILIPFFSTKKNGTGVGLSLSREIIKLHHGRLRIQTKEGEGSAFTILL
jgi:nitrogen fixation/metabolism regulation signal transduction histidine kinase